MEDQKKKVDTHIDITIDKETKRKLEKFKRQGGNVSKFIEKEIKPTLQRLDPGEQSIHVYRIQLYLSNQIIEALIKKDFEAVKVLASLANAIDDYRKLANIPSLDFQIKEQPSTERKPILKRKSGLGFLGYWNKRAERKHREELLERKLNLVRAARYCETVAKLNPNAESFLELAKTYREQIEMIDKELEGKD